MGFLHETQRSRMLRIISANEQLTPVLPLPESQLTLISSGLNELINEHLLDGGDTPTFLTCELIRSLVSSTTALLLLIVHSNDNNPILETTVSMDHLLRHSSVLGCGLLVTFHALSGYRARIEDVVVHPFVRKQGLGKTTYILTSTIRV